jgi:AmmeMemoRadiSam system protein A
MYQPYKDILLQTARDSIQHGLEKGRALTVDPSEYPEALREKRATFVTLNKNGDLRGCIGTLEAHQSLIEDVAHNAYAAAFSDPRFPSLSASEYDRLEIHISILQPPEPMAFESEQDLISQIRPGSDGLILQDQGRRGTFLPSVWESLADPQVFFAHLKLKAGLPLDYWSDTLKVYRYTTEVIE